MKNFLLLSIYNLITISMVILGIYLCKKYTKKDKTKDLIIKITSILVVLIHYSSLYVDYFTHGKAYIESSMILPIYPCNLFMWFLVILAFTENRKTKVYNILCEFTFVVGSIAGLIGVLFNLNFLNNPGYISWHILKGLFSHTVLIFGTLSLFYFEKCTIEVKRTTINACIGYLIMLLNGFLCNLIFYLAKLETPNSMYLVNPPIPEYPSINFITLALIGLSLIHIGLLIYDRITSPFKITLPFE